MRDPDIVEAELADIAAIQDDLLKAERIVSWAAMHPDEIGFAVRLFSGRQDALYHWSRKHESIARETEKGTLSSAVD